MPRPKRPRLYPGLRLYLNFVAPDTPLSAVPIARVAPPPHGRAGLRRLIGPRPLFNRATADTWRLTSADLGRLAARMRRFPIMASVLHALPDIVRECLPSGVVTGAGFVDRIVYLATARLDDLDIAIELMVEDGSSCGREPRIRYIRGAKVPR